MIVENTKNPPLNLEDHFFTEINISAVKSFNMEAYTGGTPVSKEVTLEVDAGPIEEANNSRLHQVVLTIRSKEVEGELQAYNFTLGIVGFVTVSPEYPEDDIPGLVMVYGPTLLYSAAREVLYSLTMRGPWPPVYLPTVSFIPEKRERPDSDTDEL